MEPQNVATRPGGSVENQCPRCGAIHLATASVCNCGCDIVAGRAKYEQLAAQAEINAQRARDSWSYPLAGWVLQAIVMTLIDAPELNALRLLFWLVEVTLFGIGLHRGLKILFLNRSAVRDYDWNAATFGVFLYVAMLALAVGLALASIFGMG